MTNDNVNHPAHYQSRFNARRIECIDVTQFLGFCDGNAFKYVWRAGEKRDAVEDLEKAKWYLKRMNDYELTTTGGRSSLARAVFNLIEPPVEGDPVERTRYLALHLIVHGLYDGALVKIDRLLAYMKGNGNADV